MHFRRLFSLICALKKKTPKNAYFTLSEQRKEARLIIQSGIDILPNGRNVYKKYSILYILRYITRKLIASRPIEGNNAAPSG